MTNAASSKVLLSHLIDAAERIYGLDRGAIAGERRFGYLMKPRRLVAFVGYVWLGKSLSEIGRRTYRDHTTVLHHVRSCPATLDAQHLSEIRRLIDVTKGLAGDSRLATDEWSALLPWLLKGEPMPIDAPSPQANPAPVVDHRNDDFDLSVRQWFRDNNARFIAAMRQAHPEREIAMRKVD